MTFTRINCAQVGSVEIDDHFAYLSRRGNEVYLTFRGYIYIYRFIVASIYVHIFIVLLIHIYSFFDAGWISRDRRPLRVPNLFSYICIYWKYNCYIYLSFYWRRLDQSRLTTTSRISLGAATKSTWPSVAHATAKTCAPTWTTALPPLHWRASRPSRVRKRHNIK